MNGELEMEKWNFLSTPYEKEKNSLAISQWGPTTLSTSYPIIENLIIAVVDVFVIKESVFVMRESELEVGEETREKRKKRTRKEKKQSLISNIKNNIY